MSAMRERIQKRAYGFYCERGCIGGHEQEDWLRAEKEINGKPIAMTTGPSLAVIVDSNGETGVQAPDRKRENSRAKR